MNVIATYFDVHSLQLAEAALNKLGIPYTLQQSEGEEPFTEVLVPPEHYDRGCDVAETLDQFLAEKYQAEHYQRMCPNCGSKDMHWRVDFVPDENTRLITCLFECGQCGYLKPE